MASFMLHVLFVCITIHLCTGFWFYGYDQSYRDPLPETTNNEIVQTSVITYLASMRNAEIAGRANPYTYKLIMFESIIQYETASPSNEWNLGLWAGFIYCDDDNDSLCLYFNDGEYCDNGYFRETAIELTCNYDAVSPVLYDLVEQEECVYYGKLFFPELCSKKGKSTQFLRDMGLVEKIRASSYISDKGNKIAVLPYQMLSGAHQSGLSMTINEMEDFIRITLYGPLDRYFGVGFGSNGMSNTYAIVVNAYNTQSHSSDNSGVFFEQLLGPHYAGITLEPSFVVTEHSVHSNDGVQQLTLERPLSSAVDIDAYWIFSCADADIDIIWSVGRDATFARHIASGQDRFTYNIQQDESYDKTVIMLGTNSFALHINWTALFFVFCLLALAWYAVKKYKQQIIAFGSNLSSRMNWVSMGNSTGNTALRTVTKEYGSAQDVEPLIAGGPQTN